METVSIRVADFHAEVVKALFSPDAVSVDFTLELAHSIETLMVRRTAV